MSEMIERTAEALYKEAYADRTPWLAPTWEQMDEITKGQWRGHARTVIEAMRQPTIKMQHAFNYQNECVRCESHRYVWQTMIDEALK